MSENFTVIWEAEDGYVGGSRPHRFKLSAGDFSGYMSDEDLEEVLYSATDDAFREKVTYSITNQEEVLEWMKAERDRMRREEG